MPRLYYRDPITGAMKPVFANVVEGGTGGTEVNEVTVAATQPTDGSELWMDTTANKLKYRHPITGVYTNVPDEAGASTVDGTIYAGTGMTGGGKQSTSPTLNVAAGSGISVTADAVAVNKGTLDTWYQPISGQSAVTITNWNSAVNNDTTYRANSASNAPDTGWFYGICLSHDASYKHQLLFPYANGRWNSGVIWERELEGGVWGDWNRLGTYLHSRDALDAGTFAQHNGTGSSLGIRRSFWGVVKDKNSNNASNSDAWRVTYYNTAGSYLGQAITIPLGTGVVSTPQSYAAARAALHERTPIQVDAVATVGAVVDIVTALMARAGITVDPAEVISLMEESPE